MVKLQENKYIGTLTITISIAIAKVKGWKKGDEFVVSDMPNGIKQRLAYN